MPAGRNAEKMKGFGSAENGSEYHKQMLQSKLGGGEQYVGTLGMVALHLKTCIYKINMTDGSSLQTRNIHLSV